MRVEFNQIMFPVQLKNGQMEDSYDLRGSLGWRRDIANLALTGLLNPWGPLALSSAWVLRELAYHVGNHAFLRMHCCPKQIMDRIYVSQSESMRVHLGQALCCLTAVEPDWASECASDLLVHSLDLPHDSPATALLIATIGNFACDPGNSANLIGILDTQIFGEKLLFMFSRTTNDELMTDILRLIYNLISIYGLDILQAVQESILMELLSNKQPFQTITFVKYTLDLVNLLCGDAARLNSLVSIFRIVELFQYKLKPELKYHEVIAPRLSLFLVRVARDPLLRSSFVAQGGISLSSDLFWSSPLDEIVRLNCILVLSNLLDPEDKVDVIASASQAQFHKIILEILEFETHIELVTRALDLWLTLLEVGDEWKRGIRVITTLLRSPDFEVQLKALTLLEPLSSDSAERRIFCCISDESPRGNTCNIRYLCDMLVDTGPVQRTGGLSEDLMNKVRLAVVRVISKYTSDSNQLVQENLRNCKVGPLLYKCMSTASPELQNTIVEAISPLFLSDTSACRSLIMDMEAISLKPIVKYLIDHAEFNQDCRLALDAIATNAYKLSNLGRFSRDIIIRLKNCSGEGVRPVSNLIKSLCADWGSISDFPFKDACDVLFLWLNHELTDVVINCLCAILELCRCNDLTCKKSICCASRIHAIISAYSDCLDPPPEVPQKVLEILCVVFEQNDLDPTFMAASAPLQIGKLLRYAIIDGKSSWLRLSVRIAQVEWVRVMLAHDVAVVQRCLSVIDSRCISDALSSLGHFNPSRSAKIALSSWWIRLFAVLVRSVGRWPQSGLGKIALTAFERLPIAELGEINPVFFHVDQLSLLNAFEAIITADNSLIRIARTSRNRKLTSATGYDRSEAKFGPNPISECLKRIHMQLES